MKKKTGNLLFMKAQLGRIVSFKILLMLSAWLLVAMNNTANQLEKSMSTPYQIVRMKSVKSITTSRSGRGGNIEAVMVIVADALLKYSTFHDLSY